MNYSVSLNSVIDFAPSSEVAEILQNIRTILSTRKGTVPLDREFGLSWGHLDKPHSIAKSLMKVEVIDAINKYEPRASVIAVEFDESAEDAMVGLLKPRVIVSIGEEDEE